MTADEILKHHQLKNSACRLFIINELIRCGSAMSEHQMKAILPDLFARVTFYRSLKTLEDSGVIHHVVLCDGTVKYALSDDVNTEQDHPHFHCKKCDGITCLNNMVNAFSNLPGGFLLQSTQVLMEGICPTCKK